MLFVNKSIFPGFSCNLRLNYYIRNSRVFVANLFGISLVYPICAKIFIKRYNELYLLKFLCLLLEDCSHFRYKNDVKAIFVLKLKHIAYFVSTKLTKIPLKSVDTESTELMF